VGTTVARSGPVAADTATVVERTIVVVAAVEEGKGRSPKSTRHSVTSWISSAVIGLDSRYTT